MKTLIMKTLNSHSHRPKTLINAIPKSNEFHNLYEGVLQSPGSTQVKKKNYFKNIDRNFAQSV